MDRLQAVITVILGGAVVCLAGCDGGDEQAPAPAASRVVAVAKQDEGRSPEAFCDTYAPGEDAARFEPPPLANGAELPSQGWRWINVWATWCQPCVEEMPLLAEWKAKLGQDGARFELAFLSVDEDDEVVSRFRSEHPQVPETLRIEGLDDLPGFLESVGLDEGAPIPIQLFVGPDHKLRCVRAGAIGPDDYSAVQSILL
jgi:thiol-disulfide isomerase/thioredoxin